MRKAIPTAILTSVGILLFAFAEPSCSDSDDKSQEPTRTESQPSAQPGAVPQTVLDIEGDAEDAIDQVFGGRWDRVGTGAGSLEENWNDFLASPEASGVTAEQKSAMDKAIADLSAAAQSQDALAARQAANDVSKVIVDIFDLFEHQVPSDIGRLDWQERQVLIDVDRGDWAAVAAGLALMRQTFNRAKPGVIAAGGEREVADFEASLNQQDQLAAAQDSAIVDEGNVALELVDDLERVY